MKRLILAGLIGVAALAANARAQDKFSQAVRPEEFAAAGLAKLSAEERGRLDALVEAYKTGALAAARRDAEAAAAARVAAEAKAEAKQTKKAEAGFLAKAKVMLTPGTEVEYLAVESRIKGKFEGWEGRTVFTLENGQRWQLANADSYYAPTAEGPKVVITPAAMGGFWMSFPELKKRVRVKPL